MVGRFRGKRVSLAKWTNREIGSKAEANIALDELRAAIRDGTYDERGLDPPAETSPMTFGKFAEVYKQRHVLANVQHHRLPAEAVDRAVRRSSTRGRQDRRHRRLRRGPEATARGQRPGRQTADPGVRQPDAGAAPSHAQLGRRPRIPRSNTLPARHRGASASAAGSSAGTTIRSCAGNTSPWKTY
jgi:hypothetical protein